MAADTIPEAWVRIPTEAEIRVKIKMPAGKTSVYKYGFVPAIRRLLATHPS